MRAGGGAGPQNTQHHLMFAHFYGRGHGPSRFPTSRPCRKGRTWPTDRPRPLPIAAGCGSAEAPKKTSSRAHRGPRAASESAHNVRRQGRLRLRERQSVSPVRGSSCLWGRRAWGLAGIASGTAAFRNAETGQTRAVAGEEEAMMTSSAKSWRQLASGVVLCVEPHASKPGSNPAAWPAHLHTCAVRTLP